MSLRCQPEAKKLQAQIWQQKQTHRPGDVEEKPPEVQQKEITLDDQPKRIDWFIEDLRKHKDSARALDLTPDGLLAIVILPKRDRPVFVAAMKKKLKLKSTRSRLAEHL